MSVAQDQPFGPYTAEDLHALPDGGKGFELVDGWLIDLTLTAPHNLVVDALLWVLKPAAVAAVDEGEAVRADDPFPVSFDPADLVAWRRSDS